MTHFPKNLSILRRRAGYTQESLAEALGVSRQAVGKWESGQTMPEAATLPTLADLLGCTLDQLMREELREDLDGSAAGAAACQEAQSEAFQEEAEDGQTWQEQEAQQEADWAVFLAYDAHMDRFSRQIAGGLALILGGVASMMALNGLFGESGLTMVPMLGCIALAVYLLIVGGIEHDDFQKDYPFIPYVYPPDVVAQFRKKFAAGMGLSIAGILASVAAMLGLESLFEGNEVMESLIMALFLAMMAPCIGAIVYLGLQKNKYEMEESNEKGR